MTLSITTLDADYVFIVMLVVVMLNVIVLNVVAPCKLLHCKNPQISVEKEIFFLQILDSALGTMATLGP